MRKPIVHAYFMCHNEEKILPHLLRYYSTFCEKIHIVDNMSDDRSVEIINSFENTEVIPYNTKGKFREDLLTGIRNNIWKNSQGVADYVIVGDADEFLYKENMLEFLTESFANGITVFKPVGSHMIGDTELDLKEDDNIFELIKEGVPVDALNKMMMFDCNKISEMNYSFGCHAARPVGEVKLYQDPSLKMLHYKFIGLDNHLKKNKSRGDRLSDYNKKHRLTVYYLYSDEEATNDYMNYLNKRVKIID
jgi:glycosyltransferase involved in cell wall biosynthesis